MQDFPNKTPAQAIVHLLKAPRAIIGGIIRIPKQTDESYEKLICTEQDIAIIHEIVITMSENGKLTLLFKQGYLKELGYRIAHLNPLKFMTSVFCYPHLNQHMAEIFGDFFKRMAFMNGLAPSLSNEVSNGKLTKFLQKFAEEIKVPLEKMQPYIDRHEWEELCEFIIAYQK